MRTRGSFVLAAAAALSLATPAHAWTNRWDYSKRFEAAGHAEIDCDGESQTASCCICKSIVSEIETQLDNTPNDHDIDVVFRISEEKKQIKYSRSEARILEVLDNVCAAVPEALSLQSKKGTKLLNDACHAFVGEYEDELTRTFYDDFTPAQDRMCANTLQVCPKTAEPSATREEL